MSVSARIRYQLTTRGPAIATLLIVVGLVAVAAGGWAGLNPPTTEVTEKTDRQTVEAELGTSAVVVGNDSLHDRGTRLSNAPVYLLSDAPVVQLHANATVPDTERVEVDTRLVIVYRAVRDSEVFWQDQRVLSTDETTTTDGTATARTELDVRRVIDRVKRIEQRIDGAGNVEVVVRAETTYETGSYAGTVVQTSPMSLAADWYRIPPESATRQHSRDVTKRVPVDGPRRSLPPVVMAVGALLTLAGVGTAVLYHRDYRHRDAGVLLFAVHRERHDEWLSQGTITEDLGERTVLMNSLEDLVDVAIDADKRVIHDPSRDTFAVVDGRVLYYYHLAWDPNGTGWLEDAATTEVKP